MKIDWNSVGNAVVVAWVIILAGIVAAVYEYFFKHSIVDELITTGVNVSTSIIEVTTKSSFIDYLTVFGVGVAAIAYWRQADIAQKHLEHTQQEVRQKQYEYAVTNITSSDRSKILIGCKSLKDITIANSDRFLETTYLFLIDIIESSNQKMIGDLPKMEEIIDTKNAYSKPSRILVETRKKIVIKEKEIEEEERKDYTPENIMYVSHLKGTLFDLLQYEEQLEIWLSSEISKSFFSNGIYFENLYRTHATLQLIGQIRNNTLIINQEKEMKISKLLKIKGIKIWKFSNVIERLRFDFHIYNANFEGFEFEDCSFQGAKFTNVNFVYKKFTLGNEDIFALDNDQMLDENLGSFASSTLITSDLNNSHRFLSEYFKTDKYCDIWHTQSKPKSSFDDRIRRIQKDAHIRNGDNYANWQRNRKTPLSLFDASE